MDGKCKTMDKVFDHHVASPGPQKIYFRLAEENKNKNIITTKSHSTIDDIHTKRHFQVMCGI